MNMSMNLYINMYMYININMYTVYVMNRDRNTALDV
jgi:hypothetical protein